jgi:hypothetical protein
VRQRTLVHLSAGALTASALSARWQPSSSAWPTAASRCSKFNPISPLAARKVWELNRRDHRKLPIVDGRTAFLGGINISSVYSGGSFSQGSRGRQVRVDCLLR